MEIIVIAALILFNGFFALSEIALVSSKRVKLEELASKGNAHARKVLQLTEDPEMFLSSVQVGITLIGIVSGAFGGVALAEDVKPFFDRFDITIKYANELAMATVVSLITYFSIVIGELLPKTIAINNPEKISMMVEPIISLFIRITYPFVRLLSASTQLLQKVFFIKTGQAEVITEEELRVMLKLAHKQGVMEKEEADIHQNVFSFVDKKAYQLMTHRSASEYIWINDPLETIKKQMEESSHSIFPVCKETVDNIIGIVTARDFLETHMNDNFTIEAIIQQPLYIPESMSTTRILDLFRTRKQHFGIVVNEYGAFEGIVTLHDLTESILGDLPSIDEDNEPDIIKREDGSLFVNGQTPIEDLYAVLGKVIPSESTHNYATVAGLIIEHIGRIPNEADKVTIGDYSFEIADMDDKRIDKVIVSRIIIQPQAQAEQ